MYSDAELVQARERLASSSESDSSRPNRNVVVSDEHRLCYVNSPKSACSSIRAALMPLFGLEQEPGLHIHQLYARHLGLRSFNSVPRGYFKFTCVRNPFDRVVSFYADKVVKNARSIIADYGASPDMSFSQFVKRMPRFRSFEPHLAIQSRNLYARRLDCVLKFERLAADFEIIAEMFGLENRLENRNSSKRGPYPDYYDAESRRIVAAIYKDDIEMFGYTF